jgi:two-component system, sensor histidine kinase RegB
VIKIDLLSNSTHDLYRPLRLSTLVRIRWLAVIGQTIAVFVVSFGLGFPLHLPFCLSLIGLSALFNVALVFHFGAAHRPTNLLAAAQLAFDIVQLAGLLWLTGGLENPFSILLLAPVSVSAAILPRRETIFVGVLAAVLTTLLAISHLPLPWDPENHLELNSLYIFGIWVALLSGFAFVATYSGRVAHEARQLADALAATELALSRQQQLSALDGLAAAAAHELGTPLSTIALAAKEMLADIKEGPLRDDLELIIEQSNRCRAILTRLRNLDNEANGPFGTALISELIAELAQPFAHYDKTINIKTSGDVLVEPELVRNVSLLYGLGNLIENAVQFARDEVNIEAAWDDERVTITIVDDGPGYAPELLNRLGEPYLTTRARSRTGGLGLGVFIAKTLLERTGATIAFSNADNSGITPAHAKIILTWARKALEST